MTNEYDLVRDADDGTPDSVPNFPAALYLGFTPTDALYGWWNAADVLEDGASLPDRVNALEGARMIITQSYKTERGFGRIEFQDRNGEQCSIQESSVIGEPAIWFGCNGDRMHLTREMVQGLLPILKAFTRDGQLPVRDSDAR